jgi:hypothetical protein
MSGSAWTVEPTLKALSMHLIRLLTIALAFSGALLASNTVPDPGTSKQPDPALLQLPGPVHLSCLEHTHTRAQLLEADRLPQILAAIEVSRGKRQDAYWLSLALDATGTDTDTHATGTLYTSTGRSFTFDSGKATLRSTLVGPINPARIDKSSLKSFDLEVRDAYLRLGLHRLHEFFEAGQRFRSTFPEAPLLTYTVRSTPFEHESERMSPEALEAAKLSEGSERAFVGAIPALTEFFRIIYETRYLRDILISLLPKSQLIKLMLPFSDAEVGLRYGNPPPHRVDGTPFQLGIPETGMVPVILSIGEEALLHITLYTTDPSYEWHASAGIVAVSILSTTHPDRRCFIRAFPTSLLTGRFDSSKSPDTPETATDPVP